MRDSYTCPRCDKTLFPGFNMGPKGALVVECAGCQYQEATLGPSDFSRGVACVASDDGVAAPGWGGKRAVVVGEPARQSPSVAPQAPVYATSQPVYSSGPVVAALPAPKDVIGMIEERSAWLMSEEARISGEIAESQARLAGVRAESKRLQKMLRSGTARERRSAPLLKIASR